MRYRLLMAVIPSAGRYGLATDEWLLPQALKQAGYQTALVGKWHLGHSDLTYWPAKRGFDYSYGPLIGEIDHFKHTSHGVGTETANWLMSQATIRNCSAQTPSAG